MRIALTGAHGTGKTTLSTKLAGLLAVRGTVGVCREAPRLIIDDVGDPEFFRRGNNNPSRQGLIFIRHLIEENSLFSKCDITISDRTLVDHLSYTNVLFPEDSQSIENSALTKTVFSSLASYDLIVKLPIEFAALDDGVRESDIIFQNQIDAEIDRLYSLSKITPVIVRGPVEERARGVLALL